MSEMRSPLARLVVFMVFLSVAGAFVAGVHYLVIDKPSQDAVKPPSNDYRACSKACDKSYISCMVSGTANKECEVKLTTCSNLCDRGLYDQ